MLLPENFQGGTMSGIVKELVGVKWYRPQHKMADEVDPLGSCTKFLSIEGSIMSALTRRILQVGCLIVQSLVGLSSIMAAAPSGPPAPSTKVKILFIGKNPDHPYGSHMYMHVSGVLAKCAELTPGVETVVSNGWPTNSTVLEGVKCIVVYTNPAAELLMDNPHRPEFEALMHKGAGLVTIHWASSIQKEDFDRLGPAWLGFTGATWVSNVGLSSGPSRLVRLIPDHPICNGWKKIDLDDEYYLSPTIKTATPLLQVHEKGGKDVVVGWVFERPDGGRSFGTTLGHSYKFFQEEAFRRMIVNGILWSAHIEVPKEGAPVSLSKETLALPPKP
jgi:type 1 glutamine amidotransferase